VRQTIGILQLIPLVAFNCRLQANARFQKANLGGRAKTRFCLKWPWQSVTGTSTFGDRKSLFKEGSKGCSTLSLGLAPLKQT
jgi:hypothetical protein